MNPTAQEKLFAASVVESYPDGIQVLDLDGRLLSMNAVGAAAPHSCDPHALIGFPWLDFWRGADREAAQAAVNAARAGSQSHFAASFSPPRSQQPKWFDVIVSPILGADGKPEKLLASSRDVTEWKRTGELLQAIVKGTSTVSGREFFLLLVQNLATGFGVRYSFVTECISSNRVRSLAAWSNGTADAEFEYDLTGAPCWRVISGRTCHFESNLQQLFPADPMLADMGAESYLGVPLRDSAQIVIGHLVIMDDRPMARDPLTLSVMETFASRAGLELERLRSFENLHRQKLESEERFRDLFDEAPIAYVHEGLDFKFIRANRAAMRILGLQPAEVPGASGKDFLPDTPDAKNRMRLAMETVERGTDSNGVLMELRRKDNGKPIWIQWWSRPDPTGGYTRTMFIDVTEQVLMEQEKAQLQAQNSYLQDEIRTDHNFGEIVGNSPALLGVLRQVEQIARIDSTVLILGETGTGKELIARAIHDRGPRKNRALVKVNCGAISAGLVESELFGHVKGAFTGAIAHRDGRFKLADGGTIFLDEVGDLPADTQVKLLRVLQEQEFEPVGSSKTIKVNVRVVAATNRDMPELVRAGKFRADLFYRLNVVQLRMPALRERAGDIHLLTTFYVQKFARKFGKQITSVGGEAISQLASYSWPGNVRELQNVIERAVILSPGPVLVLAEELRAAPAESPRTVTTGKMPANNVPGPGNDHSLDGVERRHIETVLNQTNWTIEGRGGAAHILDMNPSTLRSRMQRLNIKRPPKSA